MYARINGENGASCPMSPETVASLSNLDSNINRLEVAMRDNTNALRDGLRVLADEVKSVRTELVSAATNRDFVHKDIVRVLLLGLLILDAVIVIWFTGLAPMLSSEGLRFYRLPDSEVHAPKVATRV